MVFATDVELNLSEWLALPLMGPGGEVHFHARNERIQKNKSVLQNRFAAGFVLIAHYLVGKESLGFASQAGALHKWKSQTF